MGKVPGVTIWSYKKRISLMFEQNNG